MLLANSPASMSRADSYVVDRTASGELGLAKER